MGNVDDVAYISSLIDLFIRDFNTDNARVYISGSSNGGMTYRLSVDIPEKIRAIAPFISATVLKESKDDPCGGCGTQ